MLFNSPEFVFVFLPSVIISLYFINQRKWRIYLLITASIIFYGYWDIKNLYIIIASIIFNFIIYTMMVRQRERGKLFLIIGVVGNILYIAYFKYYMFFAKNVNVIFGDIIPYREIALPLAISFFTFQQIAFLVDVYTGRVSNVKFRNYVFFVSFFPQLIAGPIVHFREIVSQIKKIEEGMNWEGISVGISIFTVGLFKKMVIADNIAPAVNHVFGKADAREAVTWLEAIVGTFGYSFQLYFDFSGYSDMAVGLAMLFGLRLPMNFLSPYKSRNIIEFWRRWHITLSRFLRDYLYIPLGGNRRGKVRRYVNLMITMALGGLWHGASWNFVLWGALHGLFLMINHAWLELRRRLSIGEMPTILAVMLTFTAVSLAWVLFRAETMQGAMNVLHALFFPDMHHFTYSDFKTLVKMNGLRAREAIAVLVMAVLVVFFMPPAYEYYMGKGGGRRFRRRVMDILLVASLWILVVMYAGGKNEFIYFNF